jgi:hypothetical protein
MRCPPPRSAGRRGPPSGSSRAQPRPPPVGRPTADSLPRSSHAGLESRSVHHELATAGLGEGEQRHQGQPRANGLVVAGTVGPSLAGWECCSGCWAVASWRWNCRAGGEEEAMSGHNTAACPGVGPSRRGQAAPQLADGRLIPRRQGMVRPARWLCRSRALSSSSPLGRGCQR